MMTGELEFFKGGEVLVVFSLGYMLLGHLHMSALDCLPLKGELEGVP